MKTPDEWLGQFEKESVSPRGNVYLIPAASIKAIQDDALNSRDAELQSLRRDKERLDWLDKNREPHIYSVFKYHPSAAAMQKSWREAINAAMSGKEEK